jgi:hypothetical protein
MKFNLFALGRAARAVILCVVVFSLVGLVLCPELVQYTPEDPDLLAHQRSFALASLFISIFAGTLVYWDAVKND